MAETISIDDVKRKAWDERIGKVLVREASEFTEELVATMNPRASHSPEMFSTKLRERIQFRPGEMTVWAGYNGHRKSMFTGQVALDLVAQKHRVLVASLEMRAVDTLARMARQALGTEKPTREQLQKFTAWTYKKLWLLDYVGRIDPGLTLDIAAYFREHFLGTHLFLDSMMMVCASEESLDEQKQFTTDLVRFAQEEGMHVHLIAHCRKPQNEDSPPGKYDLRGSAAISDQAHNVITVWMDQTKKAKEGPKDRAVPDAKVTVVKQRNGKWEGRALLWFHEESLRFTDEARDWVEPYEGLQ